MRHITFVTTNDIKYALAEEAAKQLNFTLDRHILEMEEVQSDGETITRYKANQAYAALQKPIVVVDDTWNIPGLRGLPGAYMKDMNSWLLPEDWLRLTSVLEDRRIVLEQHAVYQDEHGQHYFRVDINGTLLKEIRGEAPKVPILTITAFGDTSQSRAEAIAKGQSIVGEQTRTVWNDLADWFSSQES